MALQDFTLCIVSFFQRFGRKSEQTRYMKWCKSQNTTILTTPTFKT
jgi:hypothetical protein